MKDMHIDLVVVERDPCGVLIWISHCLVVVWLGVAMLLAAALGTSAEFNSSSTFRFIAASRF